MFKLHLNLILKQCNYLTDTIASPRDNTLQVPAIILEDKQRVISNRCVTKTQQAHRFYVEIGK